MKPERAHFNWDLALSLYPGVVTVWNLKIRLQAPKAQWIFTTDHVSGTIDLPALIDYRFSAHEIRSDNATFMLRARRDSPPTADEVLITPPIEDLQNPPVPSPETLYGLPEHPFRVQLDDLQIAHLQELWLESYHFIGDASLSGGVDLQVNSWLELKNLGLDIARGEVQLGAVPIAAGLRGRMDVNLPGLNPYAQPAQALLSQLSAHVALEAQVQDLQFLSFYLRKAPWLSIGGGKGPISFDIAIAEGSLRNGSWLAIDTKDIEARFLSYAMTGDGTIRVEVLPIDGKPEGQLSVKFLDYAINKWGDKAPHVTGNGLHLTATTPDLTLAAPFETLDINLELPDSEIPDAKIYNAYLPSDLGFTLLKGTGRAHGKLRVSTADNIARGDLYLGAYAMRAQMDALQLSGNIELHINLANGNVTTGYYNVSGSKMTLRKIGVVGANTRAGKDNSRGWWADVTLSKGKVQMGAATFLDASMKVKFRDTVPFVTIFSQSKRLPIWTRKLLNIPNMSGDIRVLLGDNTLYLPTFKLHGGKYEVRMKLRRKQTLFYGTLYARYGIFSMGMKLSGKKSKLHIFNALDWFKAQPAP